MTPREEIIRLGLRGRLQCCAAVVSRVGQGEVDSCPLITAGAWEVGNLEVWCLALAWPG